MAISLLRRRVVPPVAARRITRRVWPVATTLAPTLATTTLSAATFSAATLCNRNPFFHRDLRFYQDGPLSPADISMATLGLYHQVQINQILVVYVYRHALRCTSRTKFRGSSDRLSFTIAPQVIWYFWL